MSGPKTIAEVIEANPNTILDLSPINGQPRRAAIVIQPPEQGRRFPQYVVYISGPDGTIKATTLTKSQEAAKTFRDQLSKKQEKHDREAANAAAMADTIARARATQGGRIRPTKAFVDTLTALLRQADRTCHYVALVLLEIGRPGIVQTDLIERLNTACESIRAQLGDPSTWPDDPNPED